MQYIAERKWAQIKPCIHSVITYYGEFFWTWSLSTVITFELSDFFYLCNKVLKHIHWLFMDV